MTKISRSLVGLFLAVSLAAAPTGAQHVPDGIEGTSKITGRVLDTQGHKLGGVRVLAHHLSSGRQFTSEPSRGDGEFVIERLPYGYYDLAVETSEGLYVSDRVVNVRPAGSAAVIFTLTPFTPVTASSARRYPGDGRDPSGIAEFRRKLKGREFWRSAKGVAVISGIAGAALLAIAAGSDSENPVTPF